MEEAAMAKRIPAVVATYRISAEEYVQMQVPLISGYPDALSEAKAAAVDGIRRLLIEAVKIGAEATDAEGQ